MKAAFLLPMAICVGACQSFASPETASAGSSNARLAFAQGACGGCHAVERNQDSPNPAAPPFARIVNQEGLTRASLSSWLRDAHNYPEEMEFYLEPQEVDDLVDYMLTLRDIHYQPVI